MKKPGPWKVVWRLWLYRLIFPVVVFFILPGLVRRMVKRGNFRRNLGQRFGFFSAEFSASLKGKKTVWLQSISVGETNVALRIAREWLLREPNIHVVISVTTSTGFDLASRSASENIHVIYNPIDFASIVRRTLKAVHPFALVLVEGTWPVLVAETKMCNIPVSLVARLSPRSARRFLRFRWMTGPIFGLLDHVFVQEPEEITTWEKLGARAEAVRCTGAIKYDEPPDDSPPRADLRLALTKLGITKTSSILLGGSTFPGEEIILARTFLDLRKRFPNLLLILVPRHVERTPEILRELEPLQLRIALRTESSPTQNPDILLINTTGELRDWYALADIVFIGKSLTSIGGQNPVEAVLAGRPVVFGPHMENFAPIVSKWKAADAIIQVTGKEELSGRMGQLLERPDLASGYARRAIAAVEPHFGATKRVIDILTSFNGC